jgi:sporulation protein YlmC with PRC-barrel domain
MNRWAPTGVPETVLVRATELTGRPVVSITEGDALADVKDVVYSPAVGRLLGLTLNRRGGIFAGPMKGVLGLDRIHAIGQDAVMVTDGMTVAERADTSDSGDGAVNVLGNEVLTDGGNRLGVVTDLVVAIGVISGGLDARPSPVAGRTRPVLPGDVVGYQITGDAMLGARAGAELLVPLPFTLAVSGSNLLVPSGVEPFIRDDLSGFDAAVAEFRSRLAEPAPGTGGPVPPADPPAGPASTGRGEGTRAGGTQANGTQVNGTQADGSRADGTGIQGSGTEPTGRPKR